MKLKWLAAIAIIFGLLTMFYIFNWIVVLKTILILLSITLVGFVLLQAGRGGGLAAIGGIADQGAFGTKTSTVLSKLTYLVGAAFLFTTILLTKLTLTSIHSTGTIGRETPITFQETTLEQEYVGHEHPQGVKGTVTEEEDLSIMKPIDATTEKQEDEGKGSKSKTEEKNQEKKN